MFTGISDVALDAKGRLAIPSKYRPAISAFEDNRFHLTIDNADPCLLIYPHTDWERFSAEIFARKTGNPRVRRLYRLYIAHHAPCELDAQFRMLIPAELREFAGLEKNVVLVGQGRRFELWDAQMWKQKRLEWMQQEAEEIEGNSVIDDLMI